MDIKKQRKLALRRIEWILSHAQDIRQAVIAARVDRNISTDENIGGGRGSMTSDPTARDALIEVMPVLSVTLRSGEEVEQPEAWLDIIGKVYRQCTKQEQAVFDCRYKEHKNITATGVLVGLPTTTCYGYIVRIRRMVLELALQDNLILLI